MKNPPPHPRSNATPRPRAEPEKTKALGKDVFSQTVQPTSRRSVLNALDALIPETRKKTVLTTSRSRVFKPPGRGEPGEIKFSDDDIKESAVGRGPSILEVIDNIRSPSPDFGSDDMDDLIRAAPDSALDVDNFGVSTGLTPDNVEQISSPSDAPRTSLKRFYDPSPGPDRSAKRIRRVSDWEGDTGRSRFRPVRSDSVQEVGALSMYDIQGPEPENFRPSTRSSDQLLLCSYLEAVMKKSTVWLRPLT